MNRLTILLALAAMMASLTSQPSFAFRFHLPRIHVPHPPAPSGPFAPARPPSPWGR